MTEHITVGVICISGFAISQSLVTSITGQPFDWKFLVGCCAGCMCVSVVFGWISQDPNDKE